MKFCRVCYIGNSPITFEVRWLDGSCSSYTPTEDILYLFDSLVGSLKDKGYFVYFPSPCKGYEDTDFWSVVLVRE